MAQTHLDEVIALQSGFDTVVGENGGIRLSGGQREQGERRHDARALYHDPPVLFSMKRPPRSTIKPSAR